MIGAALAACVPEPTVWAVDVNERAVLLTSENAAGLGLADRLRAVAPDKVPSEVMFDVIWSNPPIRVGKKALHDLLLTWLSRLKPGGRAVMVVGKFLGADSLQTWLGEQGYPTSRVASGEGFRVLEARPGRERCVSRRRTVDKPTECEASDAEKPHDRQALAEREGHPQTELIHYGGRSRADEVAVHG